MKEELRIRLIHWNAQEADERARILRAFGYIVDAGPIDPIGLRRLKDHPPDAVVIDLARLPSHGREIGVALRTSKATRRIPLLFVAGEPEKVERVRALLPDAVYSSWRGFRGVLRKAISHPPEEPSVPSSIMAAYSSTPLPKKLGIRDGASVRLIDPPDGIEISLGALPRAARLVRGARATGDPILWFVRDHAALARRIDAIARIVGNGSVWILWPKKSSGITTDLTQPLIREVGLAAGLVDYKICSFDAIWSGLRFAQRRSRT